MSISYLKDVPITDYPVGTPERIIADAINMYNLALRGAVVPRSPATGAPIDNTYSLLSTSSIFASTVKTNDTYYQLENPFGAANDITATISLPAGYYFYFARTSATAFPAPINNAYNRSAFGVFQNTTTQNAVVAISKNTSQTFNQPGCNITFGGTLYGVPAGLGTENTTGISPRFTSNYPAGRLTIFKL